MPPAFPFPQPQAPAQAELCGRIFQEKVGRAARCTKLRGHSSDCVGVLVIERVEPRAFGWCGCTEDKPCHEHERRTK